MKNQLNTYTFTTGLDLYQLLRSFSKNQLYTVTYRARKQNTMTVSGNVLSFNLVKSSSMALLIQKKVYPVKVADLLSHLEWNDTGVQKLKRQEAVARVKRADIYKAYEVLETLQAQGTIELRYSNRVRQGIMIRLEYYIVTSRYGHRDIIHDLHELDNNSALMLLFPRELEEDGDIGHRAVTVDYLLDKLKFKYGTTFSLKLDVLCQVVNE